MANYYPLIVNQLTANIEELPAGSNLNLAQSGIANAQYVNTANATITGNADISGNLNATGDSFLHSADISNLHVGVFAALGDIANIQILGGTTGQTIITDGTGVLSWANVDTTNANYANYANVANVANRVAVANVVGIGNIATINLTGNANRVLYGNGAFAAVNNVANANYSNFTNIANTANSVTLANVSGAGNVAALNLDGNASNILFGNGVFAEAPVGYSNANVANYLPTYTGLVGGTLSRNAQPNITSVGTLTGLTVSGTSNLSAVGNVKITGGSNGQFIRTDGTGNLSFATISTSSISNGISNVSIPVAGGNVITSVDGIANIMVVSNDGVTVTGRISATANANVGNIGATDGVLSGTLSVIGNANVGNIGAASGVLTGTLSVAGNANVGNIRAANGTLTGTLAVTGNANVGNLGTTGLVVAIGNVTGGNLITSGTVTATGNVTGGNITTAGLISATGNITGGNLVTGGALSVTGNANVGNLGTTGLITATGNITGGNLTTGGALSVVGNANVGNIGATNGVLTGTLSVIGNANVGNIGATNVIATSVTGTLTTNAQPNVTSVGTLTGLTVSGVTTLGPNGNVKISGGTSGQFLSTDGASNLTWKTAVTNAAGNSTQVQFNTNGNFDASSKLTWDNANSNLFVDGKLTLANGTTIQDVNNLNFDITAPYQASIKTSGGTKQFTFANDGSLGIPKDVYVNGNVDVTVGSDTANITAGNITGLSNILQLGGANGVQVQSGRMISSDGNIAMYINEGQIVKGVAEVQVGAGNPNSALKLFGTTPSNSSAYVSIYPGSNIDSPYSLVLPANTGTSGQVLQTDGTGNLGWTTIVTNGLTNGTSNIDIPVADGNVNTSVDGVANVLVVTSTGANISGTLNATGNATVGNLDTAGIVIATGNVTGGNLTTGGALAVTGNANIGNVGTQNITLTGNITGNGGTTSIDNIKIGLNTPATGSFTDVSVSGSVQGTASAFLTMPGNVTGGNLVTGGTANVTGNANVGNLGTTGLITATGNITGGNLTTTGTANVGTLAVTGTSNLNAIGNITITGGSNGQMIQTDGNGVLSFATIDTWRIQNGTSNVQVATVNGNVTVNVNGNANIATFTDTGANIIGTLDVTANANVGNIGANSGVLTGTLNVTGNANVGNIGANSGVLTGTLSVTGNANVGNLGTAGEVIATGNVTAGNLITGGIANVTGNANVGNLGTAGLIIATGNITGGNIITGGLVNATGNINSASNIIATANVIANHLNANSWYNGNSNITIVNNDGIYISSNGQSNVISVSSNGVHAQTIVSNDVTITGNLNVQGTATYINTDAQSISDPIIDLGVGANNTPLIVNDGKDRGLAMHTYGTGASYTTSGSTPAGNTVIALTSVAGITIGMEIGNPSNGTSITHGTTITGIGASNVTISSPTNSVIAGGTSLGIGLDQIHFFGWDIANSAFMMASNTAIDGNNNVTINELGNVIASLYIGNTQGNTGNYSNDVFVGGNITVIDKLNVANIQNGNSNIIITGNGNISLSSNGVSNVIVVTSTGANITGTASISGNANVGNIGATNGVLTGTMSVTGNANVGNIGATSGVLTGTLSVTGNANVGNIGATDGVYTGNIVAGNVYANTGTIGANLLTGTLTTNAQPNITSVGNLVNLTSNGNVDFTGASNVSLGNIANLHVSGGSNGQAITTDGTGNLSWISITGGSYKSDTFVATDGQTTFSATYTPVGSVTISINGATLANAAATSSGSTVTYVPSENESYTIKAGDQVTISYMYGTGLTTSLANLSDVNIASPVTGQALVYNSAQSKWTAQNVSLMANGNSNVNIATAGGNVTISSEGNANILTVTGTGANIAGTINATGNANVGNLGTTGLITATGNITGGNIVTDGQVVATGNVTGNYFIGNGSQLTGLNTSGIANGTSDINIPTVNGNIVFDVGGVANLFSVTTDVNQAIRANGEIYISSNNGHGGANYGGISTWENSSSGATNGKKYWRINNTGSLELVNSAYSATIFSINDVGNVDISGRANVIGPLDARNTSNFTGNMTFGNMQGTFASINTANVPTINSNVIKGQVPYMGAKTSFNAAIDTEITVDAFRFRISNQGGIFPQIISNALASVNIGWVAIATLSGQAIDYRGNTGVIISNSAWTTLYSQHGMDNSSDTIVVTLQNKTLLTAYRVTFMRTDNGTTTGYNIIAERLW